MLMPENSMPRLPMMRFLPVSSCALLLSALLAPRISVAQVSKDRVDGCALLAILVREELDVDVGHRDRSDDRQVLQADPISICQRTTRTVTAAFTAAVRQRSIYVWWGLQQVGNGDHCPGPYLSQCFPTQSPYMPQADAAQSALVVKIWRSVHRIVNATLQPASGSDVSRFEYSVLRKDLRFSLASAFSERPGVAIVPTYRLAGDIASPHACSVNLAWTVAGDDGEVCFDAP